MMVCLSIWSNKKHVQSTSVLVHM